LKLFRGGRPGPAAEAPKGRMAPPVRAHLQHGFLFEQAIVALERDAPAEFAGARLVGYELVSSQLDRMFGLGHLYRMRGHVGEHVGITVEPVAPRPPPHAPQVKST